MNLRSLLRQPVLTVAFHDTEARWTLGPAQRVKSAGSVPLPHGMVADGVIAEPAAVARVLREADDFPGTWRMQTVAALPAQRSVFRMIEMPHIRGKGFDEFASREIRREMPMVAENTHVSWQLVDAADGTARVLVVGVARDVLDSHVAALQAAGLTAVSADLRIIAAARSIGRPHAVIVHLEDQDVELGAFDNGVPTIVRYVAMSALCGEPDWVEQLTQELNRALKFYRDSHREDTNQTATLPICLVGGAARLGGLADAIAGATGHAVLTPALALDVPVKQDSLRFAANIGAAMKDLAA